MTYGPGRDMAEPSIRGEARRRAGEQMLDMLAANLFPAEREDDYESIRAVEIGVIGKSHEQLVAEWRARNGEPAAHRAVPLAEDKPREADLADRRQVFWDHLEALLTAQVPDDIYVIVGPTSGHWWYVELSAEDEDVHLTACIRPPDAAIINAPLDTAEVAARICMQAMRAWAERPTHLGDDSMIVLRWTPPDDGDMSETASRNVLAAFGGPGP